MEYKRNQVICFEEIKASLITLIIRPCSVFDGIGAYSGEHMLIGAVPGTLPSLISSDATQS